MLLENILRKALPAIDSDSSDGPGQSNTKNVWRGFTILDAFKDTGDPPHDEGSPLVSMGPSPGVPSGRSGWKASSMLQNQVRSQPLVDVSIPKPGAFLETAAQVSLPLGQGPRLSLVPRQVPLDSVLWNSNGCIQALPPSSTILDSHGLYTGRKDRAGDNRNQSHCSAAGPAPCRGLFKFLSSMQKKPQHLLVIGWGADRGRGANSLSPKGTRTPNSKECPTNSF